MKTREEIYKELVKQYLMDNFEHPITENRIDYLTRKANIYAVQNTNEVYYQQFK